MSDLISRQAVEDAMYDYTRSHDANYSHIIQYIDQIPSVENKGEWKSEDERVPLEESLLCWCSECNKASFEQTNFCPNCGADMRGVSNEISH